MEMEMRSKLFKKFLKKNNIEINIENIGLSRSVDFAYNRRGELARYLGLPRLEFSFIDVANNATYEVNRPLDENAKVYLQIIKHIEEILNKK